MNRTIITVLTLLAAQTANAQPFAELLEGRFDNELQVFFEAEQKKAETRARAHWAIRRDENGRFTVTRSPNAETKASPNYVLSLNGTSMTVARPDGVAVDCAVTWVQTGEAYAGAPKGSACADIFSGSLKLSAEGLEVARADGLPADNFRRARPFECWVAVLRGAKHGDQGAGAKDTDWFFTRGVWLHDQGGLATVATDETPARDLRLRLRRVAWPSGGNRPSLTLYVFEPGNDRAVSYVWGEFDATRLGINLRWMQASCTHAPDKLWH
jgi:hypothetical protein